MDRRIDATSIDGFNLAYALCPGTYEDIIRFVVPVLQQRGRYRTRYETGTLRHKLFGKGARLPASHTGRRVRLEGR